MEQGFRREGACRRRRVDMKASIWKRFFRFGWNAKHEAYYTRTRLNRMMDKLFKDKDYDGNNKG